MQATKEFLEQLKRKIQQRGIIDEEFINYLDNIFADKAVSILEVIKRGITKYTFNPSKRAMWIAMGTNDEYLIYPKRYCSCQDFYKNVIILKKRLFCKHLIAQLICETLNKYKEMIVEDSEFNYVIQEIKSKI
ncbi:MAG: hypothetical protein ACTSR8_17440 [Promethearchaeota archaeon]